MRLPRLMAPKYDGVGYRCRGVGQWWATPVFFCHSLVNRPPGYRQDKPPKLVESANEHIQAPPIPSRYHQQYSLALLHFQLSPRDPEPYC